MDRLPAEPKTSAMLCPLCGSPTYVQHTAPQANHTAVRRTRRCRENPNEHVIETIEAPRLSLKVTLVRRTGDQRLGSRFDRVGLERDIEAGVLKQMPPDDVRALTDSVVSDLAAHLPDLAHPIPVQDQMRQPAYTHWILDSDIREAVEARLRQAPNRMHHVLYALSTLGRADRKGRDGFSDAGSVLEWLFTSPNYPDLTVDFPAEPAPAATEEWWSPSEPPLPSDVMKRNARLTRDFRLDQFTNSITMAMKGRPRARDSSRQVARWILWGLAGQKRVLSEQLAAGVLECLRRVDDIAYLRWAAVAKRMESVGAFRDEALGLVSHPSPRLRFNPQTVRPIRSDSR